MLRAEKTPRECVPRTGPQCLSVSVSGLHSAGKGVLFQVSRSRSLSLQYDVIGGDGRASAKDMWVGSRMCLARDIERRKVRSCASAVYEYLYVLSLAENRFLSAYK